MLGVVGAINLIGRIVAARAKAAKERAVLESLSGQRPVIQSQPRSTSRVPSQTARTVHAKQSQPKLKPRIIGQTHSAQAQVGTSQPRSAKISVSTSHSQSVKIPVSTSQSQSVRTPAPPSLPAVPSVRILGLMAVAAPKRAPRKWTAHRFREAVIASELLAKPISLRYEM